MQQVSVLGSTGSIGVNTLDVLRRHTDRFQVFALTASTRVDQMVEQCLEFRPRYAVMVDSLSATTLQSRLKAEGMSTEVLSGAHALSEVASHPDVHIVMAAIVGAAGLESCIAAALAGKRLLLANKEALVVGGNVFMSAVQSEVAPHYYRLTANTPRFFSLCRLTKASGKRRWTNSY